MAKLLARALPLVSKSSLSLRRISTEKLALSLSSPNFTALFSVCCPRRISLLRYPLPPRVSGSNVRGYRKRRWRLRPLARKRLAKVRQPELDVKICIDEDLPEDPEIANIAETLRMDVLMAMALAFSHLDDANYQTRDVAITDVNKFVTVEMSLLLCNDDFIQKLNKEWRDEDRATDVLSVSQHIPELNLPVLILGDIVISIETAI